MMQNIVGIRSFIQRTVTALRSNREKYTTFHPSVVPPREFKLDKIQETSDLELVRMSPLLLACLDMKALRTLLYDLSGRHLASKNRLSFEQEIQKEFANICTPYDEKTLPEPWLKVASVLRNPSSWRHDVGLNFQGCKLFSHMPSSALAAAREAFAHLDKLPTRNLEEVHKVLVANKSLDLPVGLRRTQHSPGLTLKMVKKKVSKLLDPGKEGDLLPLPIERALHVVSLSARVLYGDDGGLTKLLKPLSPMQRSLEDEFLAAYSHLEKMELSDLINVFSIFDDKPESLRRSKYHCIKQLQGVLTSSMHFIYVGTLPEPIVRALSAINQPREELISVSQEVRSDLGKGIPTSEESASDFCWGELTMESKKDERIGAELEAVLGVSAQLQKLAWEYCEFFEKRGLGALNHFGSTFERTSSRGLQVSFKDTLTASTGSLLLDSVRNEIEHVINPAVGISTLGVPTQHSDLKPVAERTQMKDGSSEVHNGSMKSENDILHMDSHDFLQEVERMADGAAKVAYVLIGHLLNEMPLLRPMHLDIGTVEYLQMHDEDLLESDFESVETNKVFRYTNASGVVLKIAQKLKAIPDCVLQEAELRLGFNNRP